MNILQCPICKGFYPCPDTWIELILCRECHSAHQADTQRKTENKDKLFMNSFLRKINGQHIGKEIKAKALPSLLAEPVTLKGVDLTKPHRNPLKGMA